jgi:hypothetical protein
VANSFLKPDVIAAAALGLLERELVLPRLVTRMGINDFRGAADDTVTIRVPARTTAREYEWRTRVSPIVLDELSETSVAVTLSKHPYSAVAVTDEELTLDITSFGEQVLRPQIRAVAEKLETYVYSAMDGADLHWPVIAPGAGDSPGGGGTTAEYDNDAKDILVALVEARRRLNVKNVPVAGRVIVVGADIEAILLNGSQLLDASAAGSDGALRDAQIGRLYGMPIFTSNALPTDEAWVFHPSAFVLANVAPTVPEGVTMGSSQSFEGLAMRWIRDYDPNYLRDRSVVSAFAGYASVEEDPDPTASVGDQVENVRAIKINLSGS